MADDGGRATEAAMDEAIDRIIAVAARAPSAHNTQPWRVERVPGGIDLGLEAERLLRIGDPTGRDALLGLGCWAEAASIAAADAGVTLRVEHDQASLAAFADDPASAPDGPLARLRMAGAGGQDARAVGPHRERPTPAEAGSVDDVLGRSVYRGLLEPIEGDAGMGAALGEPWLRLVRVPGHRAKRLVALGDAGALGRRAVAREAAEWMRFTPRHPRFDSDGLTGPALLIPPAAAAVAGAITHSRIGRAVFAGGLALASRLAPLTAGVGKSHPGLFVLVADGRVIGEGTGSETARHEAAAAGIAGSVDQPAGLPSGAMIDAGRALLRAWLAAHRSGASIAPASQVVDAPRAHAVLRRGLGLRSAEVALAVFAAGTPDRTPPRSPRRSLP